MKILLISGTVLFILIIVTILFLKPGDIQRDGPIFVAPPDSAQDVTIINHDEVEHDELQEFVELPEDYDVLDITPGRLVYDIVRANPSQQFSNLVDTLFIDYYFVRECYLGDMVVGRAFIITAQPYAELGADQFRPTKNAILAWESELISDAGKNLFPEINQSELDGVEAQFTNLDMFIRNTSFTVNGIDHDIFYDAYDNLFVFATSYNCLVANTYALYSPSTH